MYISSRPILFSITPYPLPPPRPPLSFYVIKGRRKEGRKESSWFELIAGCGWKGWVWKGGEGGGVGVDVCR